VLSDETGEVEPGLRPGALPLGQDGRRRLAGHRIGKGLLIFEQVRALDLLEQGLPLLVRGRRRRHRALCLRGGAQQQG